MSMCMYIYVYFYEISFQLVTPMISVVLPALKHWTSGNSRWTSGARENPVFFPLSSSSPTLLSISRLCVDILKRVRVSV